MTSERLGPHRRPLEPTLRRFGVEEDASAGG
jgi:hypothetical protein